MLVRLQPPELNEMPWLGRQPADHPPLKRGMLWVRFPLVPNGTCVGWALASLSGCNPPASSCAGSTPARRTCCPMHLNGFGNPSHGKHTWPVRLSVRGHRPLKPGGWVRFPYGLSGQVVEWQTRDAQNLVPKGVGVRLSPWSLRSGLESGFQHGLISRTTPVRIRPPQLDGRVRK